MSLPGKLLGGLWFLFVAAYYFKYHTYYKADPVIWRGIGFTLIAFALLYLAIWFFQAWRKKTTLTLSAIRIVAGFFLTTLLTMGIFYANLDQGTFIADKQIISFGDNQYALVEEGVRLPLDASIQFTQGTTVINWDKGKAIFPPEIQALFSSPSVFSFLLGITENLAIMLGIMFLLLAVFHNTGALLLRKKEINGLGFFESVGIGMGVAMLALFGLGALGQLTPLVAWILFGILSITSITKLKLFWRAAIQKIEIPLDRKIIPALIPLTAFLILLAFNTVSTIRPLPVGFDSLILYHNTASLLTQYGQLVGGVGAYNYELLITWGLLLFQSRTAGLFIVYLGSMLGIGLLFETFRKKIDAINTLWWISFFVSLPMVSFLLHIDLKIDFPLLFFSLLAIRYAVKEAAQFKNREGIRHIVMTGIFLGIAFGVKYTTFMLLGVIVAFWAYEIGGIMVALGIINLILATLGMMNFWTFDNSFTLMTRQILIVVFLGFGLSLITIDIVKKKLSWAKAKPFILLGIIFILTMTPWFIKNGIESQSPTPHALLYGVNQNVDPLLKTLHNSPAACPSIPTYDEFSKYTGNFSGNSLLLPLKILWEVNINSGLANNRITDISFIFLGLVVWVLWGWKKAAREEVTLERMTLFTGLYGILWLLSANGIIWYGMPVLVGIIWVYAEVLKKEKWIKIILATALLLGMALIYSESGGQAEGILYAGKVINEEIFREQAFSGSEKIEEILNSESELGKNILWNGNFMQYLIDYNDRRVLGDTFLETFDCKLEQSTPQETLSKLHEYNIGYILYSPVVLKVEVDQEGPLHQRFARLEDFANNYLILEVYRPKMQLYRVP